MTGVEVGVGERVFCLPDLGEGLTEAEVLSWRVAVGARVAVDEVVVEVETAKAAVEVPVPFGGTVVALHAAEGGRVPVGGPLVSVAADAGVAAPTGAGPADGSGSGPVLVGYGTVAGGGGRRGRVRRPARAAAAQAPAAGGGGRLAPRAISPLVRRLADEHGVRLAELAGDAPGGVVRRRDVEAAIAARAKPAAATETAATPATPVGGGEERVPLRGLLGTMAERVTRSRREIPEATAWVDVDATELLAVRETLRAARPGAGIGLLALLARICVAGLARFPELNARVDVERGELVRSRVVGLGFAAQTERGLVVPVVHGAEGLNTAALAAELGRLKERAAAGALPPAALTGGTFTVNNYGVFGVDGSTPIINHPEAGMLGMGRIVARPWVVDGALAVRQVTQLSVTFDHRVCDGGVAGGFLRYVADCVERPGLLLADL
ncbi:dihydrolipoamide acetyltransferase family protein [Streptomyces sp. DSM 44915]|uniref:Dihydrolipoamide acetyltransferase component of pyruvate dehydrogenase complex n=1 Tax=Streptomyces chisholmiae TaxID=3075540 RepID=A0ABU2JR01_9ACTN|nr:dihydrolipoamide acetyltransferase family protein [Streptomyces sp. DSM 44915]MDT0267395.1 dihydrolipoamide acetyltransferase family protein [Streptomyces sp. DSM 44915]